MTKPLTDQIASVEREIRMRQNVYPRWVESKRMTKAKADHELACMESVLETLRAVSKLHRGVSKQNIDAVLAACGQEQGGLF